MRFEWIVGAMLWVCVLMMGCKKGQEPLVQPVSEQKEGVLIANEGNFMRANASLSRILPSGQVENNLFQNANGFPLGDVAQSLYLMGDTLFIVMNNSEKIYALQLNDFKLIGTMQGLTSPRYFLPVNDSLAYVSDLYAKGVHIVNFRSFEKKGMISMPSWTEEMALYQGKVWVTSPYTGALYKIDTQTHTLVDSLVLTGSYGATDVENDAYGNLWALCWGNTSLNIAPSLVKISPSQELTTFVFPSNASPSRLTISQDKQALFWLNQHVYKMPVTKNELSVTPFINAEGRNFYNLMVHPENNQIWLTDAKDYVQKGEVLQFSPDAQLLNTYKVGIIPSFMLYYKR